MSLAFRLPHFRKHERRTIANALVAGLRVKNSAGFVAGAALVMHIVVVKVPLINRRMRTGSP